MLSGANVLILDEPTNHLDIESKEVFEEALLDFPGTCIIVSHDRYFLNRIPTRIAELTRTGIENYLGTYDYYMEKKQQQIQSGKKYLADLSSKDNTSAKNVGRVSEGNTSEGKHENIFAERRKRQKEREASERRLARRREQLEKDIEQLEEDIRQLEAEVSGEEIMTDYEKLAKISSDLSDKRGKT